MAINSGFLIATPTDNERDLLRQAPDTHQQFCDALLRAGYPQEAVSGVHFRIESQETVDRDYGGSWDEATEMPSSGEFQVVPRPGPARPVPLRIPAT
jgi:hypothetical protein